MSSAFSNEIFRLGTVFIVDDDDAICDGLCNLLESVGLKAERFGSAEEFIATWTQDSPGCLMLDARLPGMTGVEFQDQLIRSGIRIPIIFMTAHGDVPMVRKVLKAGAVEFLTKPFDKEEMLVAIRHAFQMDASRRSERSELDEIQSRLDLLTPREHEVMDHVTCGLLNKQIAAELNLSEITVKLHRRHVLEKMKADSLADLVKMTQRIQLMRSE
ncbi:MAG: response regulator [Acidobacteriota bacterium]|nr:response regulator [Acidobacteriota bacterium]